MPGTVWATVSPQGPAKHARRPPVLASSPHELPGSLLQAVSTARPAPQGLQGLEVRIQNFTDVDKLCTFNPFGCRRT